MNGLSDGFGGDAGCRVSCIRSAARVPPTLKVFGARMKANGLAPKAVVGAAMRKLAHLIYGVVKSGKPFDANFAMSGLAIQDGI